MIDISRYGGITDMENLNINKLIILAGAGISISPPTQLPSGEQLTRYYLDSCIEKGASQNILQQWEEINDIIYKNSGINIPLIRLEFIIGCINDVDKEFNYTPFISGFQQFVKMKPNANHFYLGELKGKGCEIITPNFDCSIENLFGRFHPTVKLGIPVTESERGVIYHYHGIGNQNDQLGATISEIKKGIRKEFGKQLKDWFNQGYSILCIGFSCSDYFDITPFFETLPNNKYSGKAVFFQHGDFVDPNMCLKIDKFFRSFKNKQILYGDTTSFLGDLNHMFGGKRCTINDTKAIEWNTVFEKLAAEKEREKIFYIIRIMNQSGIILHDDIFSDPQCPKILNSFRNIGEFLEYAMKLLDHIDIEEYLSKFSDRSKSIFADLKDLCQKTNYKSERQEKITNTFKKVTSNKGVMKDFMDIEYEELVTHIKNSTLCPQNFITVYVYSFTFYSKKQIRNVLKSKEIITNDSKIAELYECAEKMLKLPFYEYEYVSYYLSIAKLHNILNIMVGNIHDVDEKEKDMLNIALEICAISLVISIYFNSVTQFILLFSTTKDWKYYRSAKNKMEIIKKCMNTINNYEMKYRWMAVNGILKQLQKEFFRYKRIDFNTLVKIIF